LSNIIIPGETKPENDGFAEIVSETPAPDLIGIAESLQLLENRPAQPKPSWLEKALVNVGGLNKFGEPNFRAVWGQSELKHAWGQQRLKYPATRVNEQELLGHDIHNANGTIHFVKGTKLPNLKPGSFLVPRYKKRQAEIGMPFWIIERWFDVTEVFQAKGFHETLREAWEKEARWDFDEETGLRVDNMGPFPSRGVYEHFFTVKTPDFKTRPISEDVIDIIAMTLEVESGVASGREYKILLHNLLEKKREQAKKPFLELQEKINDAFNSPLLAGDAQVSVPSTFELGE
jgi:hypothetical protein